MRILCEHFMRTATLSFSLFDAICKNNTEAVRQYCKSNKLTGSFWPSPFASALHTDPINIEILQALVEAGIEPNSQDLTLYQNLPASLKQILPPLKQKLPLMKKCRSWFQRTSLSSQEVGYLWEIACERNDTKLSDYFLSNYTLSQARFQQGIRIAKERSHHALLNSLVPHTLLKTPERRDLLHYAVERGHTDTVRAVMQELLPKKMGFFATLKSRLINTVEELRYGHGSASVKASLLVALREKHVEIAETLLQYQQFTFDSKEIKQLLRALFTNLSDPLTPAHGRLVEQCLSHPRIFPHLNDMSLSLAIAHGKLGVVKFLLQNCPINAALHHNAVLRIASEKGDIELVKNLLSDPQVDPSANNYEALCTALNKGHLEIAQLLLKDSRKDLKANFNVAINIAFEKGYVQIIQQLLKDARFDPKATNYNALSLAAKNGYTEVVELLLKNDFDPAVNSNHAIRLASENGHANIVRLLLQDRRVDPGAENNYAIRLASKNGHLEVVKLLLELKDNRINPAIENNYIICLAAKHGHLKIVDLLLSDSRINPAARDNTAIYVAVENNHVEMVKLLLSDPRVDPGDRDDAAICHASEKGYVEIVELLLRDPNVDPAARNNAAIRLAAKNGHVGVVTLLMSHKSVRPNTCNNAAIRDAIANGHQAMVKLLLDHPGVDPSAENNYVMRIALKKGYWEIVKQLLKDPCVDPSVENNAALQIALERNDLDIIKQLAKDQRVDPSAHNNSAMRIALHNEDLELIKQLIKDWRVDPSIENNYAIRIAAAKGDLEFIKQLLNDPRVDPSVNNNDAMRIALENNHWKIARTLSGAIDIGVLNTYFTEKIIPILADKQELHCLRKILENERLKRISGNGLAYFYIYLDVMIMFHLVKRAAMIPKNSSFQEHEKNTDVLKVLLTFGSEEFLQGLYRQNPELKLEMQYVNTFLSDSLKPTLKTLKADSFITINTNHLIRGAELLQKSKSQEEFMQELANVIYERGTHLLKENLKKAAKAFCPLISSGRTLPIQDGDSEKDIKMAVFPFYLAPKLAPFLPTPLARDFFETLNMQILHSPKDDYIRTSIALITKQCAKKAVERLEANIDWNQLPERSWVKRQEKSTKVGVSAVCK